MKNERINLLKVRNQMKRHLDSVKDWQNFGNMCMILRGDNYRDQMWETFGDGAVPELSDNKQEFLKQVDDYELHKIARELLALYTDEIRTGITLKLR